MKYIFAFCFSLLALSFTASAQSPQLAFNQAANLFIEGQNQQALQRVNAALEKHPNDPKLRALKEKLEKKQKEQQQQQNQQQQNQNQQQEQQQDQQGDSDKEQQEQQGQEQEKEGEGEKEQKEEKEGKGEQQEQQEGEEQKEGDAEQQEEPKPGQLDTEERLKEMDISPEKARMILEAMKSNEVQYLQQKKRRSSKRSSSNKPDW